MSLVCGAQYIRNCEHKCTLLPIQSQQQQPRQEQHQQQWQLPAAVIAAAAAAEPHVHWHYPKTSAIPHSRCSQCTLHSPFPKADAHRSARICDSYIKQTRMACPTFATPYSCCCRCFCCSCCCWLPLLLLLLLAAAAAAATGCCCCCCCHC